MRGGRYGWINADKKRNNGKTDSKAVLINCNGFHRRPVFNYDFYFQGRPSNF